MPQKNSSIMFTLLSSVFMMMFVASLFHLPSEKIHTSLVSDFLRGQNKTGSKELASTITYGTIDPATISHSSQ